MNKGFSKEVNEPFGNETSITADYLFILPPKHRVLYIFIFGIMQGEYSHPKSNVFFISLVSIRFSHNSISYNKLPRKIIYKSS